MTRALPAEGDEPLRRPATLAGALADLGPLEGAELVAQAADRLTRSYAWSVPLPAEGRTRARFAALGAVAAVDLSLARLVEGHADAVAIRHEAGAAPREGLSGVWAADAPDATVRAERTASGYVLRGRRRFASGAASLRRALVTAHAPEGRLLFDVDLARAPGLRPVPGTWQAVGMAATGSVDVVLDDVEVGRDDVLGGPSFYLSRPGFWHGAVGVAACWYGGALGTLEMLVGRLRGARRTDHQLAHVGALVATCETMATALERAADAIDADPAGPADVARRRALVVRHVVEAGCQEVLARAGRAGGTSPLVYDHAHAKRAADLVVYLRQHHAERDLAALGALVLGPAPS